MTDYQAVRCLHQQKEEHDVLLFLLVRETGLEPVRCNHTPLKRARLPVPPLSRDNKWYYTLTLPFCQHFFEIFCNFFHPRTKSRKCGFLFLLFSLPHHLFERRKCLVNAAYLVDQSAFHRLVTLKNSSHVGRYHIRAHHHLIYLLLLCA